MTHESIGLREATKDLLVSLCPNTHIRGSRPIDGIWTTPDITVTAVKWLPFSESPGDHQACLFDVSMQSVLGTSEKRIVYPACRRLISSNPSCVAKYEASMREQFKLHKIEERMARLDDETLAMTVMPPEYQVCHNCIDNQVTEIQIYSEKGCRHIYRPDCPFTIEYSVWHKRACILKQMQRMIEGRVRQPGLLCQQARKFGIMKPRLWSLEQVQEGPRVCKAWKRELELSYAPALRFEHLRDLLIDAEAKGQTEQVKILWEQMSHEESKGMWGALGYHWWSM
jgi:hypothetical protein